MVTAAHSSGNQNLRPLTSTEIQAALPGHYVSYAPPGSADAGVHEEFHADGRWRGVRYSRGPLGFEGRWRVENAKICVRAETGAVPDSYKQGWFCRDVWTDVHAHHLLMVHIMGKGEALILTKRRLER